MTRRLRIGVLVAIAALALAACSSSGATAAPASQAPAQSAATSAPASAPAAAATCTEGGSDGTAAEIKGFAFPANLSVAAGSAITWTNADSAPHTVTFDDGGCSTQVGAGASVTVTYTTPGTYAYHCTVHPIMTATLEVK
jgi:plastocyanin